jgi:trimethylamine:corrinoid methyltransferase-like protein
MPKAEAKKATSKKATPKKAASGSKAKGLSQDEVEAIFKSFHRVLRNKGVEHPVEISLTTADGNECRRLECKTVNGKRVCRLVSC